MEKIEEVWNKIPGFSRYEVSNFGEVKTFNWMGSGLTKILKQQFDEKGYKTTPLINDYGKRKTVKIHRLVCMAFLNNLENKLQVNHINGIKTDNRLENLEWCTASENQKHAIKNGLIKHFCVLTNDEVIEIRNKYKYSNNRYDNNRYSYSMLAKEYNVSDSTIAKLINRKTYTTI